MTSHIRRRVATLAALPVAVTLLGFGLAGPAFAFEDQTLIVTNEAPQEEKSENEGLKAADLGNTGRLVTGVAGNIF